MGRVKKSKTLVRTLQATRRIEKKKKGGGMPISFPMGEKRGKGGGKLDGD